MSGKNVLRKSIADALTNTNIDLSRLDKALGEFEDRLRNVENKLELYKSKFDVVITNDGSMNYVNKLMDELNGTEK